MKKKILFIMNNLNCGGAEKALISLLETLDYSQYEVDVYLLRHSGLFLSKLPPEVRLLPEPAEYRFFDMSMRKAVLHCLRRGQFKIAILRLLAGSIYVSEKNRVRCEQRVWKYLANSLKNIDTKYDIAVGYLEKNPIYFCIDKVQATKKIGFIHNDYDKLGMDPKLDQVYFNKLDYLVTVSEECGHILRERFPNLSDHIEVMHNIVSPSAIQKLAMEQVNLKDRDITIVSVGRLNVQKGFELAIESCQQLVQQGYPVKWYIIGEGEERERLEKLIEQHNLQETFILLGIKENPYPYIREADIYVQPSKFEGKSIAIDEAKILQKPIVVTNFTTAKDQIKNKFNGIIVAMTPAAVCEGIKEIIENEELRKQIVFNLGKEMLGTESEIYKLYQLFM
ncbi:glycosyltransferase [Paenibacillus roseipurpureus]|uniref:Glycosyltransferase n=1 Tax=Paenibacillus roseopurpureus TaxID=2918901 RepID=A0AA96LKZ2_9BACL|nr:glycosyltransferase [Paenibacillus sp. MBLB1832]WNR43802.1 glycosyltransferase [Paenibacillus sp. MBLB1832]